MQQRLRLGWHVDKDNVVIGMTTFDPPKPKTAVTDQQHAAHQHDAMAELVHESPAHHCTVTRMSSSQAPSTKDHRARYDLLGIGLTPFLFDEVRQDILECAQQGRHVYGCLANVHMVMEARDNVAFATVVNQARWVLPDGRPLYWWLRQRALCQQIRGLDLMVALLCDAAKQGIRIGLYGGQDQAFITALSRLLWQRWPDLSIVYAYAPPFRPLSDSEHQRIVQDINRSQVQLLFVGIGCPRQELWMSKATDVSCVQLGVGAAFDFLRGHKRHAPAIFSRLGLEWLWRLACEPRRLSGRYLRQNPRFLWALWRDWRKKQVQK